MRVKRTLSRIRKGKHPSIWNAPSLPEERVRITITRRRINRRPRIMSSIDAYLLLPPRLTSLALGPIMNVELKDMQATRREKIAAGLIVSEG